MADTHETIADIIAWLRRPREGENAYLTLWRDEIADRLEAAHRRERGDCAKLREALKKVKFLMPYFLQYMRLRREDAEGGGYYASINNTIDAALAAPPRNCDLPLVVDGPADNNADKAWLVFKRHNPDVYFDVPGLLRCIDWLFAPATEKEGGNDGNE